MLWNVDRSNVPTARVTGRRLIPGPEAGTRVNTTRVQNVFLEPPHAREENESENKVALPDGCTDTRTQILNFLIFLTVINFALNIYILHHLITIRFF